MKYKNGDLKMLRKELSQKRSAAMAKKKRFMDAGVQTMLPQIKFPDPSTLWDIDDYTEREGLSESQFRDILNSQIAEYDEFLNRNLNIPAFKKWRDSKPSKQQIGMVNFLASNNIYTFDEKEITDWGIVYGEIRERAKRFNIASDLALELLDALNVDLNTIRDVMNNSDQNRANTRRALTDIFKTFKSKNVVIKDLDTSYARNTAREAAKMFKFQLK